jgi:hypothetical protein
MIALIYDFDGFDLRCTIQQNYIIFLVINCSIIVNERLFKQQ